MCGVPRAVAAALLVGVSELRRALAIARPVVARVIGAVGVAAPVRLRAGQDVVLVGRVAHAVHGSAFFGERELLAEDIPEPGLLDRVAVQLADVLRHALPPGVVPGSVADPIARVDGARSLRAEIRVPRRAPASGRRSQCLAVGIRAGQTAEVRAVALADARHEERHRLWRWLR